MMTDDLKRFDELAQSVMDKVAEKDAAIEELRAEVTRLTEAIATATRERAKLPSPKLRYAKDKDGLRQLHKLGDVWMIYVNEGDLGNLHRAGIAEEVTAPREGGDG